MILHRLDDEVLAVVIRLEQRFRLDSVEEILLGKEGQPHVLQELGEVAGPLVCVEIYPGDDAFKHLLLAGNCDGVTGYQLGHLLGSQTVKLVTFKDLEEAIGFIRNILNDLTDLCEVPLNVRLCGGQELETSVEVGEGPDAEAVGGVELRLEELAASVPHICQLEQVGGGEQRLDILLRHINLITRRKYIHALAILLLTWLV